MNASKYTKEELKKSVRFGKRVDLLEALLEDDVDYSIDEAEEIMREFLEGSV